MAKKSFAPQIAAWLALIGVLALLYFFPPDRNAFYPRCMLHSLTGLNCPFCGGLRATHQLLHGNFHAAIGLNPLVLLAIPVALILFVIAKTAPADFRRKLFDAISSRISVFLLVSVLVLFAVLRNFPIFS